MIYIQKLAMVQVQKRLKSNHPAQLGFPWNSTLDKYQCLSNIFRY